MRNIIKEIFLKVYMVYALLVFAILTITLSPFAIIPLFIDEKYGSFTYKIFWFWAIIFFKTVGISYKIEGKKEIDKNKSYIFVSNHGSYLDAPIVAASIPIQFRTLGKIELTRIPLLGIVLKKACVIVDRSNTESRKKSVEEMIEILKLGISILVFPEGTQNRTGKILAPFFKGAFRIALETNRPIMPMVIIGANKLLPPSSTRIRPGKIKIIFGKEITPEEYSGKSIELLKMMVFERMKDMILKEVENKERVA